MDISIKKNTENYITILVSTKESFTFDNPTVPNRILELYKTIVHNNNLEPLSNPVFDVLSYSPFEFQIGFATRPNVSAANLENFEINSTLDLGTHLQSTLDHFRYLYSTKNSKSTAIKLGDEITVNYSIIYENQIVFSGENETIYLTSNSLLEAILNNLIGKKAGDTVNFYCTFPQDYHIKPLSSKNCSCKYEIISVNSVELPELNEEFFSKIKSDKYKNLHELKENISQELIKKNEARKEINLLEYIIENSQFDHIPDQLFDEEAEKLLTEYKPEEVTDKIQSEIAIQAIDNVKLKLALDEIFKDSKWDIYEEDYLNYIEGQSYNKKEAQKILQELNPDTKTAIKRKLQFKKLLKSVH